MKRSFMHLLYKIQKIKPNLLRLITHTSFQFLHRKQFQKQPEFLFYPYTKDEI
ncbi:hypothetical protein CHU_1749 [Cytophaga hutchinsonii ATCC 33406]|uniref:Uncharacterized protein n=1 Tax=Cytophaga hutchinsonii (strain ATCC 33406 / DSM 1761 / CIP 103989 / NBRC 15051 / NCIMB 9469 / D465) TaxID=269798 RepID=A0A6N4SRV4_CYTH3|nr:hypothetical protein CHU_1749 [Cytophaga hutchinsonii ATCC 33406]